MVSNISRDLLRRIAIGIFVLSLITSGTNAAQDHWPFQALAFDKALAAATQDDKLIFIDFYTTWCGPCKMLDQSTLKDAWVRKWLGEQTVALKVDAEKDLKLAEKFKVEFYPTLLFLDRQGKEIERQTGYISAKDFRALAKDLSSGVTALARAERELRDTPNDPRLRLELAAALQRKQRNADALREYLWCLDRGAEYDPSFAKEHTSVIEALLTLAAIHEPANEELRRRRDAAERRILDDRSEPGDAELYVAVGMSTTDNTRLLATFDAAASRGLTSPAAAALAKPMFPVLLEAKRYDVVVRALDVPREAEQALQKGGIELDELKRVSPDADEDALAMVKAPSIVEAARYFQALLGADRSADAKALAGRVLDFDKSADTYHELAWQGYLSGKPLPECLDYGQKALEQAPADKRANVTDTVARLMASLGRSQEGYNLCERALADAKDDRDRWILTNCVEEIRPKTSGQ